MRRLSLLALALLVPALGFAQGTPAPPIDEPPAELPDESPPRELPPGEELPPQEPEGPGGEKSSDDEGAEERPKPKPARVLRVSVVSAPKPSPQAGGPRLNVDVEDLDLAEVMEQIARRAGASVLTARGVQEQITISLREIPWREAVSVIARMTRCEVREAWPGVLLLEQPALVTTTLEDAPLRVACEQIGEAAGIDVVIGPGASGSVSLDLKEVSGPKALELAARSAGVHIEIVDGLALITKEPLPAKPAPPPAPQAKAPYVDLVVEDGHVGEVALRLAKTAGLKLLVDSGLDARLSLSLTGVDWRSAVEILAERAGATVEEAPDGILRLVRGPKEVRPLSLRGVDLREALRRLAAAADLSLIADPQISARVTVSLVHSPRATLFGLVRAAGLQVEEGSSGVLLVGPGRKGKAPSSGPARPVTQPGGKRIDVSFDDVDLADAMEVVGQKVARNILVDPNVVAYLSCHLTNVDWRLSLDAIAASLGCEVEERAGGILLFTQPPPNRVLAKGAPIGPLLRMLAAEAGWNLVLTPGVTGKVDLDLRGVYWLRALELAARVGGCRLVYAEEEEVVIVVRERTLPPPAAAPADQRYQEEIARLVGRVEAAALGADLRALGRASADLQRAVQAAQPAPRIPAPVPVSERGRLEREREIEVLRDKIEELAKRQDTMAMSLCFQKLRGLVQDLEGLEAAKRVFGARPLVGFGDLGLSIKLQLQIAEGNLLLKFMATALEEERYADVLSEFAQVRSLKDAMHSEERDVFKRNAKALFLRGRALEDVAERLLGIERRYAGLRVQATITQQGPLGGDPSFEPRALINGRALVAGDREPTFPEVVSVEPGRVQLRDSESDTTFSRAVK